MAGTNQIFTIVAFALLVVLVLGLGLLVAILVQRRRTKRAKVASEQRRAERRRAEQAGVAGLHEDTETSGGISLLGLSVQAVPHSSPSAQAGPSPWAAAPRQAERSAAWLPASVQQASSQPSSGRRGFGQQGPGQQNSGRPGSGQQGPGQQISDQPGPGQPAKSDFARRAIPERVAPTPSTSAPAFAPVRVPVPEPDSAPAPHAYGSTFSGRGTSKL
ncbi:hypothetical protein [Pseudoclavibacter helvolus]|uniref:hypothetical protein n=1 Tax=Pseudoclavibacter helvolus TaxID=255205 RepID=UPI000839AE7C|nr:hypothetical protein [Pseudoclavibacter helvolus]